MRSLVLGAIMGALAAGSAQGQAAAPPPGPTDYRAVFESVWTRVNTDFYDPGFRGHDWRAIGDRYRGRLPQVRDDAAFERLVEAMLAELNTSHLAFSPPRASSASGVGIGALVEPMEGAATVLETAPLSDARRKGLKPGDQIVAGDTFGPAGSMASLTVKACDGAGRTVQVRREAAFWPPPGPAIAWSKVRVSPDRVYGYLKVDRFSDGQAEMADRAMAELKDTSGLVVDIRDNSGGNTSAIRLASYFTGPEGPAVAVLARPWLVRLGRPVTARDVAEGPRVTGAYTTEAVFKAVSDNGGGAVFWTEDMGEKRYDKPVVVLIGEGTGSAAEGFAWMIKLKSKARLVGRPTPGVLLSSDTFDVGGGWRLTIPVSGLWGPEGQDFGDKGVTPAESIPRTRADICTGRDRDLERAVDILDGQPPTPRR